MSSAFQRVFVVRHEEFSVGESRLVVANRMAQWFVLEGHQGASLATYDVHPVRDERGMGSHALAVSMAVAMHRKAMS